MALGSYSKPKNDAVFVDIRFKASAGPEAVGFRQTLGREPNPNAQPGEPKWKYDYLMHNQVSGKLVGVVAKEEPTYDDKEVMEYVIYAKVEDEGHPDTIVKFPLASSHGRKTIGLLNAVVRQGEPKMVLFTGHRAAGVDFAGNNLAKPRASINARLGSMDGVNLVPVYMDENGLPILKEDGTPAQLPMGEEIQVGKGKTVWNFDKADEAAMNTAVALMQHFTKDAEKHAEQDGSPADSEIDLGEAAAAASPTP